MSIRVTVTLSREQIAIIKWIRGDDFDPSRLVTGYLDAKVEQDRQMLETLEAQPPLCRTEYLGKVTP